MAEVTWSRRSLNDLRDIEAYIAQFDRPASERMSRRLRNAGNSLSYAPRRGRRHTADTRVLVTVSPYLIYYDVVGDDVTILTIRHSARQPLA